VVVQSSFADGRVAYHEQAKYVARLRRVTTSGRPVLLRTEREAGHAKEIVAAQVKGALSGFPPKEVQALALAYEPVWAIGTGQTATPSQAEEMHAHIRMTIAGLFGADVAKEVRILYGGSVKPENAQELLQRSEIDGALVGGASLQADSFASIVNAAKSS
jgi:triosephosphate isomerase